MSVFTLTGFRMESPQRAVGAMVSWYAPSERRHVISTRGLVGDETIIQEAVLAEAQARRIPVTATGPDVIADLDDPVAALVLLGSLFVGRLRIDGDAPRVEFPIPPGAVA